MFDQEKIGKFIAERRKMLGYTQKQLADQMNISDRTVSKWETGKGLPDTSLMEPLGRALDVKINELLSGELLSEEDYDQKVEERVVELIRETEKSKRISTGIGITAGGLLSLLFLTSTVGFWGNWAWYIDVPSAACVIGFTLLALGISGHVKHFFTAFLICFGKRSQADYNNQEDVKRSIYALKMARIVVLLSGTMGSLLGVVLVIGNIGDMQSLGPNLAVSILTLLYGVMLAILFTVVEGRLQGKENTYG